MQIEQVETKRHFSPSLSSRSVFFVSHSSLLPVFHQFVKVDAADSREADRGRQIINVGEGCVKRPPVANISPPLCATPCMSVGVFSAGL